MAILKCPDQTQGKAQDPSMIAGRIPRKRQSVVRPSAELIEQTRRLMERTIEFIAHDDFDDARFVEKLRAMRPVSLDQLPSITPTEPGLAFVSGMVQKPLLTPDEERYLFLRMNFLKSRAERRRRILDLGQPDRLLVNQINADLEEALRLRNQIVEGNLRLVVAIASKLTGSLDRMSDLISEGTAPLIRSAELFDIGLGNRFSTYATWAVRNQMLRRLKRIASIPEFSPGEDAPSLENLPDNRNSADSDEISSQSQMQVVNRLLSSLSERERSIIAARFGLHGHPRGQSLSAIAGEVGLCKERVRQILLQSLAKLRSSMTSDEPDQ